MKKHPLAALALVLVAAAFALAPVALAGCSPAATKETARDTYAAQQLKCVKDFDTRVEIDACRARVKDEWGRNTPVDAGTEGGAK